MGIAEDELWSSVMSLRESGSAVEQQILNFTGIMEGLARCREQGEAHPRPISHPGEAEGHDPPALGAARTARCHP